MSPPPSSHFLTFIHFIKLILVLYSVVLHVNTIPNRQMNVLTLTRAWYKYVWHTMQRSMHASKWQHRLECEACVLALSQKVSAFVEFPTNRCNFSVIKAKDQVRVYVWIPRLRWN